MEIVYLRGIKKGDKTYYQKEGEEINEIIDSMSKKTIKVVVQGERNCRRRNGRRNKA